MSTILSRGLALTFMALVAIVSLLGFSMTSRASFLLFGGVSLFALAAIAVAVEFRRRGMGTGRLRAAFTVTIVAVGAVLVILAFLITQQTSWLYALLGVGALALMSNAILRVTPKQ